MRRKKNGGRHVHHHVHFHDEDKRRDAKRAIIWAVVIVLGIVVFAITLQVIEWYNTSDLKQNIESKKAFDSLEKSMAEPESICQNWCRRQCRTDNWDYSLSGAGSPQDYGDMTCTCTCYDISSTIDPSKPFSPSQPIKGIR